MRSELYLWGPLRSKLINEIKLIIDTYNNRISPVFANIEADADMESDKYYRSFAEAPASEDDIVDLGNVAEDAIEVGLEFYQGMSLMKYNNLAGWLTILYQYWEQQVRLFLFDEERHYFEIDIKSFCTNGINDIKKEFMKHNVDIEKLHSWNKVDELRLLCNTIKHGDGNAAESLRKLQPKLFKPLDSFGGDLLDLYKTTLNDEVLEISNDLISEYGQSLMDFWGELDERMYSNVK
jgi:hypothetical protein